MSIRSESHVSSPRLQVIQSPLSGSPTELEYRSVHTGISSKSQEEGHGDKGHVKEPEGALHLAGTQPKIGKLSHNRKTLPLIINRQLATSLHKICMFCFFPININQSIGYGLGKIQGGISLAVFEFLIARVWYQARIQFCNQFGS